MPTDPQPRHALFDEVRQRAPMWFDEASRTIVLTRYEDPQTHTLRSFCARCGAPVTYERPRAPKIVNIPRALFSGRTGREPRYHMFLTEAADWTYLGEPLSPLKGYPGVMRERPRKKKRQLAEGMF